MFLDPSPTQRMQTQREEVGKDQIGERAPKAATMAASNASCAAIPATTQRSSSVMPRIRKGRSICSKGSTSNHAALRSGEVPTRRTSHALAISPSSVAWP